MPGSQSINTIKLNFKGSGQKSSKRWCIRFEQRVVSKVAAAAKACPPST
jgi:hypothetical protein